MKTMAPKPVKTIELEKLFLKVGKHANPEEGMCVMEAVAFMSGERFTDHPKCACPVISAFLRRWNDRSNDEQRQELKRYIPLLIGSKSTLQVERKRAWLAADWAVRTVLPAYLDGAKLSDHAKAVRALDEVKDATSWSKAKPVVGAAREASRKKYLAAAAAADAADAYAADAAAAYAADAADAAAADAAARKMRAGLSASAHDLIDRMLAVKD